jgi:hypothetical protein
VVYRGPERFHPLGGFSLASSLDGEQLDHYRVMAMTNSMAVRNSDWSEPISIPLIALNV